jgi:CubicO group peptidase (beta-lactamase class C family)
LRDASSRATKAFYPALSMCDLIFSGVFERHPRRVAPARLFSGGGGLVSTAVDYLRFCQMLLNGGELDGVRFLAPTTILKMTTSSLPPDIRYINSVAAVGPVAGTSWGLGFAIRTDPEWSTVPGSVGTFTWGGVWGTTFWIDPPAKLIALQMIQVSPSGNTGQFARALRFLTYAALHNPNQASAISPPTPVAVSPSMLDN